MKCCLWVVLLGTALGQSTGASPTGREWGTYAENVKVGYVLGFINGTSIGAFREFGVCLELTNISLGIINTSNDFFKQWRNKYPEIVTSATSEMLKQADRPQFKQEFCLQSARSGFENITVGQFLSGVNAFYGDYRNQGIPVNYAIQYARDDINGKSPAELNADLLLERKCIADPKNCTENKPSPPKP